MENTQMTNSNSSNGGNGSNGNGSNGSGNINIEMPPFIIAIDDREKEPFAFPGNVQTRICHLPFGDYSLVGYEHRVAIERKSIADLCQTLWGKSQLANGEYQANSKRFAYELQRMRDDNITPSQFVRRYVAIEGTQNMLEQYFIFRQHTVEHFGKKQRADYAKTMAFISSLEMRYGMPFHFFPSKEAAAAGVYSSLYHAYRFFNGLSKDPVGDYLANKANNK